MRVLINGRPQEVPAGCTVAGLLESLPAPQDRGVAVAVGGEVIPRGEWESTQLRDGARVEIVVAVQGG